MCQNECGGGGGGGYSSACCVVTFIWGLAPPGFLLLAADLVCPWAELAQMRFAGSLSSMPRTREI